MFIIPAAILGVFLAAGAGYLIYDTVAGRRSSVLDAVRRDPADHVHARLNEETPHQLDLNRKVNEAQRDLTEANEKAMALGKDLPTDPPPRKWVITTLAFTAMWAVAFVVQFLLDYRIAKAITGNTGAAVLTSLVVSGLLSAITLAAAQLWEKRSNLERRQVVLGLLLATGLMCAVISVIVTLAPKRATQDYAQPIETAKQQLVMFNEDGDTTAADLTRAKIERLEKDREQAKTFYQATAVATGILEGGASLAVPGGYLLLNYYGAQGLVRKRTKGLTKAQNRVARRRERFAARMSRLLERAGIAQDRLGPLLNRTAPADNPARLGTPPTTLTGPQEATTHHGDNSGTVPSQRRPGDPPPIVTITDAGDQAGGDDDAPDPSFDQA